MRVKAFRSAQTTRNVRDAALRGLGGPVLPWVRRIRYSIRTQYNGQRIWKLIVDADLMSQADARDAESAALSLAMEKCGILAIRRAFSGIVVGGFFKARDFGGKPRF